MPKNGLNRSNKIWKKTLKNISLICKVIANYRQISKANNRTKIKLESLNSALLTYELMTGFLLAFLISFILKNKCGNTTKIGKTNVKENIKSFFLICKLCTHWFR